LEEPVSAPDLAPVRRGRALLLENIHTDARTLLSDAGWEVETASGALDEAELARRVEGVSLLGIRSQTQVTAKVLEAATDLRTVGAFCIGTNQIDLFAAAANGIAVFNAPYSNTRSVVELALAEIIALTRRLTVKDRAMHDGVWDKSAAGSHEVRGRRLGIVGYGNIGSQLSVVAEALGMSVFFYDTTDKLALGNARRCGSLHELLEIADVVSLHVDGRRSNTGFFGEAEFSRMRPGSIFLNLSRGFVVDDEALARHVRSGHVAGAALDVFPTEPKGSGQSFDSVLRGLPNVILTPHVAGSTEEAQEDIGRFVAAKMRDYALHGTTALSVNLPTLDTETAPETVRLAHLHRNVPGVLAAINKVLADAGVNIEGQQLATRGDLGYVVTDIAAHASEEVGRRLRELPETVRVRQLG
jgi:D-3-phosphoglycerate dehydrogenase